MYKVKYNNLDANGTTRALLRQAETDQGSVWFEVVFQGPIEPEKTFRTVVEFDDLETAKKYLFS